MASLEHIIVLMMENHSFDRMLGALLPYRPDGGGIKDMAANLWNDDTSPTAMPPIRHVMAPTTTRLIESDPMHDLADVLQQIGAYANPTNLGYVTNYATTYPTIPWPLRQEMMGYYDVGDDDIVPNLHTLAKNYTICDRWFSSLPGPTFPNRVFMHTGTSRGYTTNSPSNEWIQTSIYTFLDDNGISWGIYYGDMSSTVLLQPEPLSAYPMRQFWNLVNGDPANVPQYCFLEPNYGVYSQASENDQHPMSDVVAGDLFIRDVYNKIRANESLWQSSLLVIVYDEHGGFYDHVPPPATVAPDQYRDSSNFNFETLGVRVPAVVVSPWLDQGVISDTFDHTSALKFLIEQFGLATGYLGDRVADQTTHTFTPHLRTSPRPTYGQLPTTNPDLIAAPANLPKSDFQQALIDVSRHRATQISDAHVRNTLAVQPADPAAQGRLAVEQFEALLTDRAKQRPVSTAATAGVAAAKRRKTKPRKIMAPKIKPRKTKTAKAEARKAKARKAKARKVKGGRKSRPKK